MCDEIKVDTRIENNNKNENINIFKNVIRKIMIVNLFKNKEDSSENVDYYENDVTTKKEDYQIAICQDGKFAVTFDMGKKMIYY
jgi:hypothetical protein